MNSSLFARLAVALPRPFTKSSLWAARGWGSKLAGDVRGWFRGDRWVSIRQAAGTGAWSWQQLRRSACPPPAPAPHLRAAEFRPRPRKVRGAGRAELHSWDVH